jgi:hypothetical protein
LTCFSVNLTENSYTIRLNITQGSFEEFFVLDGDGEQVTPVTKLSSTAQTLNFTLDTSVDYAFLAALTRDTKVEVQYDLMNATKTASACLAMPNTFLLFVSLGLLVVIQIMVL